MIDLHMHTKYSNGTDDIIEFLQKAEKNNIEIISITDLYINADDIVPDFETVYNLVKKCGGLLLSLIYLNIEKI